MKYFFMFCLCIFFKKIMFYFCTIRLFMYFVNKLFISFEWKSA
jgi:hypothetical protein